jgi:transcriptional regulator with XRE-family HTH domain
MSAIRELRAQLGQSQAQFAVHFHVNQATISRWETIGVPDRILVDSLPFIEAVMTRIRANMREAQEDVACTQNLPNPSTEPASTD